METFTIKNLNFAYPNREHMAISDLSLNISQGEFITICGKSGCGKSTLLRQLKTCLAPTGKRSGSIYFEGELLDSLDNRIQSQKIGYVLQSPDNQIVTDKVWHELAFGLESLGYDNKVIRLRVAEMASFFGIGAWFHKSVVELSGGQKQLLNLASVMALNPSVLILDEPTSQLDPIAATDFLETIKKINREIGTTIIMTEHRLEDVLPMSDTVVVMEAGKILSIGNPMEVGEKLRGLKHDMFLAMPTPMRIYAQVNEQGQCPITIREGKKWLNQRNKKIALKKDIIPQEILGKTNEEAIVEINTAWFRYEKEGEDVIKDLTMKVYENEIYAIVGGNGAGKSTTLSLIAGILKPYRGKVKIYGKDIKQIPYEKRFDGLLGVLPQNPQSIFTAKTVQADLMEILADMKISKEEKTLRFNDMVKICELEELLGSHPYDLSGGEMQRAALAKILMLEPSILLLDEPTKGLDAHFKIKLSQILRRLRSYGTTIIIVSHDIEFCGEYANRCAMFFDGNIVTVNDTRKFFSGNSFYTTSSNRMARHILPEAIVQEDIVKACGIEISPKNYLDEEKIIKKKPKIDKNLLDMEAESESSRKLTKRTMAAMSMILIFIPLTIWFGIYYLGDRKYYFISMLVILESILPFVMVFEDRKPQARELIVIAVLCAIAVAGRTAFFMIPQFKPVVAIAIIAGISFGGETGFLVGAMSGFVSNFFFGQGPLTPWQMFGFGIIGFLAGICFRKGLIKRKKIPICIFGGLTTFFIYGGLLNPASVLTFQLKPTWEMFMLAYLRGIPFDLIHAAATVIFLAIIAKPMMEKLERIKIKYGLISE